MGCLDSSHCFIFACSSALLVGCPDDESKSAGPARASAQLETGEETRGRPDAPAESEGHEGQEAESRVGAAAAPEKRVAPFEGTVGIVEKVKEGEPAVLSNVRAARHPGFDRVVFEFATSVPGYHLEYIDHPVRACGSGDVVEVTGEGWLQVRLSPAHAHDERGQPTIVAAERALHLPNLLELVRTCDFEAVTTYVLGLDVPTPYRVLTLERPARLVVDVQHRR